MFVLLNKSRVYSHDQVKDITQEYRFFLYAYQSDLLSYKRYFVIAFPVICIIVFRIKIWYDPNQGDALLSIDNWLIEILSVVIFLSMGYFWV
jgi:hypothetical protein